MQGKWVVGSQGTTVQILSENGTIIVPSGIEIWAAEFEDEQISESIAVGTPSLDLRNIEFAAESPTLDLILTQSDSYPVALAIRLGDSNDHLLTMPQHDQIIHDGRWYCLDLGMVESLKNDLERAQIQLGDALSQSQVFALSWKNEVSIDNLDLAKLNYKQATNAVLPRIRAELYEYQKEGVIKLIDLYQQGIGSLLADEMGLGKTLQVIALLVHAQPSGPSLVVCPASTLANWKREIEKFAPELSVALHQGRKRAGAAKYLSGPDVIITSYETLVQDVYVLRGVSWAVVAFDEAQYLKNPEAQRTKSAKLLHSQGKVAITGTPIENSLKDMWSITDILAHKLLPQLDDFLREYPDEEWAAHAVGRNISPITIRRTVKEVGSSLPSRIDTFVPIIMGAKQSNVYQEILESQKSALAKISQLRVAAASLENENSKIEFLYNTLLEAARLDKKVLIFASFTGVIEGLKSYIKETFPEMFVEIINGETEIDQRQSIIDCFSEHGGPSALILNPKAAGVGLNIQAANYVIHFTPEWNPAIVDQASARAYRTGQQHNVFIYYLYFEDSVEQIMVERLESKRGLQRSGLLGASAGPSEAEVNTILSLRPGRKS